MGLIRENHKEKWHRLLWIVLVLTASGGTANATTSLTPSTSTVNAGTTIQFTLSIDASLTPVTASVQWSVWPHVGTISNSGLYTAPNSLNAAQSTRLVVLVVPASASLSPVLLTSKLNVEPPVSVAVSPATASLTDSATVQLTATVANTSNTAVNWTVHPAVGTVSSSGLYRAPSTIASSTTVIVTATSRAEPSQSGTANITLTPPSTKHEPAR